jgi:cardiolipin synthase
MGLDAGEMLALAGGLVALLHLAGLLLALRAVMTARTSQGAIAWAVSLVEFPYIAVPLYLLIGHSRFEGYVTARRHGRRAINKLAADLVQRLQSWRVAEDDDARARLGAVERLAGLPITRGNRVRLLVDGDEAFAAMFADVERATAYVLIQFFIVRDDPLGRELKDLLVRKAREGVRVHLLVDAVGSYALPSRYDQDLRAAGVLVERFRGKGRRRRTWGLQINFRNHRKITVVDGACAYIGGLNVGDEYRGRSPRFGPWRDTHVRIEGPAVRAIQLIFLEDWCWAHGEMARDLAWEPRVADDGGDERVLVVPSGPADELETCNLMFIDAIHAARQRFWIASPYFVPDSGVIEALQLAALRGVDVRVLLPLKPDHLLVYLSSFSYLDEMERAGVKMYRYRPGFMHQKVFLVDDDLAAVGTANLDNRSFRLNFEVSVVMPDPKAAAEVAKMLERDFANSRRVELDEFTRRPLWFRVACRLARLLAPVQ